MLNALLVDMKLDSLDDFSNVGTDTIRGASSEIDVAKLQEILRKYTSTEDMFTQNYLHGRKENIKLLVDMGKAVEAADTSPDKAHEMLLRLSERDPLYVRCLVQVYKDWYNKSFIKTHPLDEVKVEAEAVSDAKVVLTDEFGLEIKSVPEALK